MNREIKFRGKRVDNGKWERGCYVNDCSENKKDLIITAYHNKSGATWSSVIIPETAGQYTGLKDKNGVEIYEGDILDYMYKRNVDVVFQNGRFCLRTNKGYSLSSLCIVINEPCEIIGNIHENPELLECKNESI